MKQLLPFITAGGDVYRARVVGFFDAAGPLARQEVIIDATQRPAVVRRRTIPERQLVNGQLELWTVGFLVDLILTRDPFMHRLDIHAATGLPPRITAEHEGRIVDGVVREWADRHGKPYTLELTGPAGGRWSRGDGEPIRLDALDFCRVVSGRPAVTTKAEPVGLLAVGVPF